MTAYEMNENPLKQRAIGVRVASKWPYLRLFAVEI